MKTALITGILGQDGAYLAKFLLDKGYQVHGMVRRYTAPNYENLDYLGVTNKVNFVLGDMTDQSSLLNVIRTLQPDEVYNLAAQSFVGSSWDIPIFTVQANAVGVVYLLDAIKTFSPQSLSLQHEGENIY